MIEWLKEKLRDWLFKDIQLIDINTEDIKDIPLLSGVSDFVRFKESSVWLDIENVLKMKLKVHRDELETMREHNDIIHTQGQIYEIRTLLMLPKIIHEDLVSRLNEGVNDGRNE